MQSEGRHKDDLFLYAYGDKQSSESLNDDYIHTTYLGFSTDVRRVVDVRQWSFLDILGVTRKCGRIQ